MTERNDASPGAAGASEDEKLWAEFEAAERNGGAPADAGGTAGADADDPPPADAGNDREPANQSEPQDRPDGTAAQAAAQDDPWKDAPPALREQFEAQKRRADQLEQRARSAEGRAISFQRLYETRPAPQPQSGKDDKATDGQTNGNVDDGLKKLGEEYPEIGAPVKQAISARDERLNRIDAQMAAIQQERMDAEYARNEAALATEHPDWVQVADSPEFSAWLSTRSARVREIAEVNARRITDPAGAAELLTLFKAQSNKPAGTAATAATGKPNAASGDRRRQNQLDSSAAPRSGGPQGGASQPGADTDEAMWQYWEAEERRRGLT